MEIAPQARQAGKAGGDWLCGQGRGQDKGLFEAQRNAPNGFITASQQHHNQGALPAMTQAQWQVLRATTCS
ncbi:MAG: hypothetical protein IPO35_08030 [Uliginosibacterium sp.]|nr:hypothetical protein [Uliginosibacterium sp.]